VKRRLLQALLLLAAAGPALGADDPGRCKLKKIGDVPLHRTGETFSITATGSINGKPAEMLVAPGADTIYISASGAGRLELAKSGSQDQNGMALGPMARLKYPAKISEFTLGPFQARSQIVDVLRFNIDVNDKAYDALLGAHWLFRSDVEISLPDRSLKFFSPEDCKETFIGYWKEGAIAVPMKAGDDENPIFEVELDGHKLKAEIDPTAWTSHLSLEAAKSIGVKLDAPAVKPLPDGSTDGVKPQKSWVATFDKFAVGSEVINQARLAINEYSYSRPYDIVLGADFLQSHRALFAVSQGKLYLSYTGGPVFHLEKGIEPWLQREADEGNPHAQLELAGKYSDGDDVEVNPAKQREWLQKAAGSGLARAQWLLAEDMAAQGKPGEAAARIRQVLDKAPNERSGALALYRARVASGDAELGKRELEQAVAGWDRAWPTPIAEYYLGHIDGTALLARATEKKPDHFHKCEAQFAMGALLSMQGKKDQAKALADAQSTYCSYPYKLK
jgi:hypothetical protein